MRPQLLPTQSHTSVAAGCDGKPRLLLHSKEASFSTRKCCPQRSSSLLWVQRVVDPGVFLPQASAVALRQRKTILRPSIMNFSRGCLPSLRHSIQTSAAIRRSPKAISNAPTKNSKALGQQNGSWAKHHDERQTSRGRKDNPESANPFAVKPVPDEAPRNTANNRHRRVVRKGFTAFFASASHHRGEGGLPVVVCR
jgi:hypothetical protein